MKICNQCGRFNADENTYCPICMTSFGSNSVYVNPDFVQNHIDEMRQSYVDLIKNYEEELIRLRTILVDVSDPLRIRKSMQDELSNHPELYGFYLDDFISKSIDILFEQSGYSNYVRFMHVAKTGNYDITFRRVGGLTPWEKLDKLQEQLDRLQSENQRLNEEIDVLRREVK